VDPKNNRWIKLKRNGSFESGGDPHGYNDGKWELDSEKLILFLESNTEDDDSEWKIAFDENKTIWTGIGTPRQEGFKLIHKKWNKYFLISGKTVMKQFKISFRVLECDGDQ